ncbi:valine--tRNA ligase [Spiroplasma endosymbiont of Crioceris asparagi]|uniref:valine--tRNA ligase n=1 Tax=Spiroplasma endosymbiont of Crioceris asparagi TaxID=3066286 RepID=UPI0030D3C7AA
MESKYNHLIVEQDKNSYWIKKGYFNVNENSKKPAFSIIMPPPNVTGKLHLGHSLDNAIQDLLIRFKKLNGFETLWVPGMDHAGIATQAVVEKYLREANIDKNKLTRKEFLDEIWKWKAVYEKNIKSQWDAFGLAIDRSKEQFTFSEANQKIVRKVFVEMYKKGLIYQDYTLVNWDPQFQTAISNIEVIYKESTTKMYYFKYFLENSNNFLEVATTRPETMFGDVCLVVNPLDERFKSFIGKKVINPVNGNLLPIIGDEYVDIDFGTGVMKCTPAHDKNDFELGKKHHLEMINCMNLDGSMNEICGTYQGLDRFAARKQIIKNLTKSFIKEEEITSSVGYSEKSNAIVEPMLSKQWFVKMKDLGSSVVKLQASKDKINVFDKRFNNDLLKWMENVYDWTISRQLVWGHQIPVWYHKQTGEIYCEINPPKNESDYVQDNDVLDTWFSSALWPLICMEWNPDKSIKQQNQLFNKFFPNSVLVTGYDIIFFWASRMIFQSLNLTGQKPFQDLLLHGLVRDENGRKMSKSLGNGIDPLEVIKEYGVDSLRYALVSNSTPGMDIKFSEEKIRAGWNFINKLWNASRYVIMNLEASNFNTKFNNENFIKNLNSEVNQKNIINKWIIQKLKLVKAEVKKCIETYNFSIASKLLTNFVWNDYCSWFIELAKSNLNDESAIKNTTLKTLVYVLKDILIMLHPFIPFVTEEIYQKLNLQESIVIEDWDDNLAIKISKDENNSIELIIELISKIREFRTEKNIANKNHLTFVVEDNIEIDFINQYLNKMVNSEIKVLKIDKVEKPNYNILTLSKLFLYIKESDFINYEELLNKLSTELALVESELKRSNNILSNKNFLAKAAKDKIVVEQQKQKEYENKKITIIQKIVEIKK